MSIHIYKYKYQTINFPPCVESPIKIQEKPFDPEESIRNGTVQFLRERLLLLPMSLVNETLFSFELTSIR